LDQLGLNERQKSAVAHFRSKPELTNAEYQSLTGVSRATAKRDLDEMIKLGILMLAGAGRSAHYRLANKRLTNGSNGSFGEGAGNGS
jgi:ATP-dependent DNA helicase RecG